MVKLINLTPHAINVLAEDRTPHFILAPSGAIARVAMTRKKVDVLYTVHHSEGMAVYQTVAGEIVGLPDPVENTFYVVSKMVQKAAILALNRLDVLSPGELVRDDKGQPIGCVGLDNE